MPARLQYCLTDFGKRLVEESIPLADKFASTFSRRHGCHWDQCQEIARTSLVMIAATHDPNRGPWEAYMKTKLWYELIERSRIAVKARVRARECQALDFDLSDDGEHSRSLDEGLRFDDLLQKCEPRYRELIALRFRDGLDITEIGRRFNVHHNTIKQRLTNALISIRWNLRKGEMKVAS